MPPETRLELQRLLSALCDGMLTDTEHARLEELLGQGAACRRVYLDYLDMHAGLLVHPRLAAGPQKPEPLRGVKGRGRARQVLRYTAVAVGTLAASLLVQVFLHAPSAPPGGQGVGVPAPEYVATLAQAADCVWEGEPRRAGSRLLPGELRLKRGLARLHIDGGPDLLLEGPAILRIDSRSAATVLRGKVVFRADDTAAPFDLHTPTSTLMDLGTEYAVVVGAEGEEVHVFDGEVRRLPRPVGAVLPENLAAGEARRYGPSPAAVGQPTPLDPTQFVRQVTDTRPPRNPAAGLLAYEGFAYRDPDALQAGRAAGGRGWVGPWRVDFARPLVDGDPDRVALNVRTGLSRGGAPTAPAGGCFEYAGFTKVFRRLATPVRLDDDGVYYLSFLFRREAVSDDPIDAVAVLLWTDEDVRQPQDDLRHRLNFGVRGPNLLFTHLQRVGARAPLPLSYGVTYLLVAKIVAGGTNPDQVFLRVYGPDEPVERDEPGSWSIVGPSFESDLVFDWLQLHVNSKRRQTLDEVRLGTTWESVTAP